MTTSCLFSSDFFRLAEAEQDVIHALEVAASTVEEIAKGSEASQQTLEHLGTAFLELVQGVQQVLVAVAPENSKNKQHQGSSYSAQLEASLLQQQVDLAEQQLRSAKESAASSQTETAGSI